MVQTVRVGTSCPIRTKRVWSRYFSSELRKSFLGPKFKSPQGIEPVEKRSCLDARCRGRPQILLSRNPAIQERVVLFPDVDDSEFFVP